MTAASSSRRRPYHIAVVGSSGGGAATLGHTDPVDLLKQIQSELHRVRVGTNSTSSSCDRNSDSDNSDSSSVLTHPPCIQHALYVSLHSGRGLDGADEESLATLYAIGCSPDPSDTDVRAVSTGPLHRVNEEARRLDATYIASSISTKSIDGMISISSDPLGVNSASIQAAAKCQIPLTGSGGTSISAMTTEYGVKLVGNSGGSVATTTYTRAVSYVCALADAWSCQYSPFLSGQNQSDSNDPVRPGIRSVLDSCVPAFVAVCVICRLLELSAHWLEMRIDWTDAHKHSYSADDSAWQLEIMLVRLYWQLQQHALPTTCAVIAASSYAPEMGSVVLMASAVASVACGGSVVSGLLAGCAVAYLSKRILFGCIKLGIPATMTNVLVAGGVGCIVALGMSLGGIVSIISECGNLVRSIVRLESLISDNLANEGTPLPGLGFLFGIIFCYGSKVGWYHKIYLPIILVEMERGEASILGAVDECTLCLVSGGICLGNLFASLFLSVDGADVAISKRGLRINLLCGDFIEAAYPFMERSMLVNGFAYLASGVSTEILLHHQPGDVLSSAYLPVGLSIILANDWRRIGLACMSAFGISFVGAVFGNIAGCNNTSKKRD